MSTILEELTKYRSVLCEMDQPRREKCSGCGRDKMKKQLRPIKGKDGLYCQICQIPYGRKKDIKESSLHNPPDQIGRLLDILNGYAEKMNQLSMRGKNTKRFQLAMDKVEETILSYPDGQTRLNDFWAQYNQSFDEGCERNSENIVTEYQNPAELPAIKTNSAIVDLGKQNAMEELGDIIAKIPPHQVVPYAEFGKTLVSLHRKFNPGSDEKVVDFTRGWNSILQKVNELVPKSREKHMTKDELETVLSVVGQKELNWN